MAMLYGCAGRFADAQLIIDELDERQNRGEYIIPAAKLSASLGLQDVNGIRTALAACVDGGAAPFAVVGTNRWLLDAWRHDEVIGPLLERLHDGARPS